jgi:hypothetical protein
MTSSLKQELAQLAADGTIAKLKKDDFREALTEQIQQVWDETEKAKAYAAAKAQQGKHQFTIESNCGATRQEFTLLLPKELKDCNPFVWRKGMSSNEYEITLDWATERDTLIQKWESETQKEQKRKREEEEHEKNQLPPKEHPMYSPVYDYKDNHVVFKLKGKHTLAKCKNDMKGYLTVMYYQVDGPPETIGISRLDVLGIADLSGRWVQFMQNCELLSARVGKDTNMPEFDVTWYDTNLKVERTMMINRKRVTYHPDHAEAEADNKAKRARV